MPNVNVRWPVVHWLTFAHLYQMTTVRWLLPRSMACINIAGHPGSNYNARWPTVLCLTFAHLYQMTTVRWLLPRSTACIDIAGYPGSYNNARWRAVSRGFVESYRDACRPFYGIGANLLNTAQPTKAVRYGQFASANPLTVFKQ